MEINTHRKIQETLLNKLILILGFVTVPALTASLLRIVNLGWQPLFGFHIIIATIFLFIVFYRNAISYHLKVGVVLAIFSILGILSALNIGLMGFLIGFLMLCVFFGVIFWGRTRTLYVYFGAIAIIITMGVLNVNGLISPKTDIENYTKFYSSWITTIIGFSLITALSALVIGEIGHLLSKKIIELENVNNELLKAHDEINKLSGLLPICSHCKKIRDDGGYWNKIEDYISQHSDAVFSHSICRECAEKFFPEFDVYDD